VDAVIDYLGHMPGRDDLRVQKLRRYLERDVRACPEFCV
jgi:hypothetical protein